MRRILAALAAIPMLLALVAQPAHAVDTRWIKYNWCDVYENVNVNIHVCSGIEVRRQNDGSGLLVRRFSHYLDITGFPDPDDCGAAVEHDPAVVNNKTYVDAENIDGGFITQKWFAEAPAGNLTGANNCSMDWTTFGGNANITVNTQRLEGGYNYKLRMNNAFDQTSNNWIDIWVGSDGSLSWGCYVSDRCNRTVL